MGAPRPSHLAVLGCVCLVTVIALIAAQRNRR